MILLYIFIIKYNLNTMIYTQQDPGPWFSWSKRPENKKLPVLEAKRKYLKEQLLYEQQFADFVAQQQAIQSDSNQGSGLFLNKSESTVIQLSPTLQSITGNTQSLYVTFKDDVVVTGSPRITATNNQAGGGSAATFLFTHKGLVSGTTNVVEFIHIHPATANNNAGIAANTPISGSKLFDGMDTSSLTTPTEGDYTVLASITQGSGGDAGVSAASVSCSVSISALQTVTDFKIGSFGTSKLCPGNQVTIAGSDLGGGGSLVSAISASNLLGDTISIGQQNIDLNGGSISTTSTQFNTIINNKIKRQGAQPNLFVVGSNTKTAVAS